MDSLVAAAAAARLHPELLAGGIDESGIGNEDDIPAGQNRKKLDFVPFTCASYQHLLMEEAVEKRKESERKDRSQEAHLKDGELKFGLDEDEMDKRPERNPDLEEGKPLKEEYGQPPAYYMGLPLEEIDKGIKDKTFVVLSRWLHTTTISRFTATPSCFILPAWNPLRRIAVYLITNQVFDFIILVTILTNCICLAIPDVNDMEWLEYVFFGIYSTEMIIKMVARGIFLSKYTYLADPWNWLDLLVILSGIPSIVINTTDMDSKTSGTSATQALRTFRVLRAVKTISIFPGLRTIVNAMLRAIKMLLEVVMMTVFCLLVFSLVSVQIYRGSLRQKCVRDPMLLRKQWNVTFVESYDAFYRRMVHDNNNWATTSSGDYVLCGNASGAGVCEKDYICLPNIGENPNFGFMNFDNILWSALITFQLMTIDYWENAYRKVLLTNGSLTVLFFIMTVFFGSFYLLNLMLAVVTITYQEEAERTNKELEVEKAAKKQKKQAVATFYNINKLATKQSVWAKLIQENKMREKEKGSPLERVIRVRKNIHRWKKYSTAVKKNIAYFEHYATEGRNAYAVQRNVLNHFHKWVDITRNVCAARAATSNQPHKKLHFKVSSPRGALAQPLTPWKQSGVDDSRSAQDINSNSPGLLPGHDRDREEATRDTNLNSAGAPPAAPAGPECHGLYADGNNVEIAEVLDNCSELLDDDTCPHEQPLVRNGRDLAQNNSHEAGPRQLACRKKIYSDDEKGVSGSDCNVNAAKNDGTAVSALSVDQGFKPAQSRSRQVRGRASFGLQELSTLLPSHNGRSISPSGASWQPVSGDSNMDAKHQKCKWCRRCAATVWVKARLSRVVQSINNMVTDIFFDLFINFCIVLNTIVMSLEHHGMGDNLRQLISITSMVFAGLFALEAVLKIIGLGIRRYFVSKWNRFDFVIAIVSIVSIILEQQSVKGTLFLRAFRLLRVLKLAQVWPAMNTLLRIIGNAVGALGQLTFILLIILYIFSIIGLLLFKGKYQGINFPKGVPRWHFNDFFHSFMMMFRVLCGEWIEPLWDCMRINAVPAAGSCVIVFFPTLIFGNFVVLNLFLALLLNAFGEDSTHDKNSAEAKRLKEARRRIRSVWRGMRNCCCRPKGVVLLLHKPVQQHPLKPPLDWKAAADSLMKARAETSSSSQRDTDTFFSTISAVFVPFGDNDHKVRRTGAALPLDLAEAKNHLSLKSAPEANEAPPCWPNCILTSMKDTRREFNRSSCGKSWMKFRTRVMKAINNDVFEYFILFLIMASSVILAFEDYEFQHMIPPDSKTKYIISIINIILAALFTIEMVLRWIGFGITRYFTNAWTLIDFVVVLVSVTTVVSREQTAHFNVFRAFRALRALRPLRVVSRIQGMKIVVNSLMRAIPAILNVFMVSLVFWLIFCVMGVQFFAGKFYKCIDINTMNKVNVAGKAQCTQENHVWFNSHINFDNVGNGFLALFQVATFEGWMEIMTDAVDSTFVDKQPEKEASLYTYLYFVAFIICGSFFSLNLVIGVIIDNFNVLKKKYEGSYLDAFLTLNQRNFYNTLKKMSARKPQKIIAPPRFRIQQMAYDLSVSDRFELILMGVVFLNMIVLAVEFYEYRLPCLWVKAVWILETAFCTFFAMETFLKIFGLRQHYFTLPWNTYDFIVAVVSVVDVFIHMLRMQTSKENLEHHNSARFMRIETSLLFPPSFLRLLRIFRISRVLRIIKVAKGLRKVMFSLVISLPAIINIMALLMLCLFIYAIFGMFLFANVKLTGALTPLMNFRSFKSSALVLLSLSTAAGWNDILDPLLISPPFCNETHLQLLNKTWVPALKGECGNYYTAIPFMVTYIIITYLFIINMYIAVILENYNQAHQQEEVGVTEDDFDMFYSVWQRYDPHASQFIPYAMLSDFVADLDDPLGIGKPNEIALVSINLPILQGDRVHCLDILLALVKNVLTDFDESEEMFSLKQQINAKFSARFPTRAKMNVVSTTIQRKKEDVAARTLQRAWQMFKTQQAINSIMKLAMSEPHGHHSSMAAHTLSSVEDLGFNLALAYAKYFHNLMSMPTYGRELKPEVEMSTCSSKQSLDDGSPVDRPSPKVGGVHFLNPLR